jgi:hypothetical protein
MIRAFPRSGARIACGSSKRPAATPWNSSSRRRARSGGERARGRRRPCARPVQFWPSVEEPSTWWRPGNPPRPGPASGLVRRRANAGVGERSESASPDSSPGILAVPGGLGLSLGMPAAGLARRGTKRRALHLSREAPGQPLRLSFPRLRPGAGPHGPASAGSLPSPRSLALRCSDQRAAGARARPGAPDRATPSGPGRCPPITGGMSYPAEPRQFPGVRERSRVYLAPSEREGSAAGSPDESLRRLPLRDVRSPAQGAQADL